MTNDAQPPLQYPGSNRVYARPEPCSTTLRMDVAIIVDAINAVDNEVARRLLIAALMRRCQTVEWALKPGGWLSLEI